jgi:hypothetical protein
MYVDLYTERKINEDNLKENIRDAFFSRFFGGTAKNMYRVIYFSRGKSQVQAILVLKYRTPMKD